MKIGRVFPDLLTGLGTAASVEEGLALTLRRLVRLTGARAGALTYQPPRGERVTVTAGPRRFAASIKEGKGEPSKGIKTRIPLGAPRRALGALTLVARGRAGVTLPSGFGRELG